MKTLQPIIPFLRRLLLFLLPLWLLVVLYVLLDPFLVVWHYDNYYYRTGLHPTLDMDYVSCENYVNRDGVHHYNAFIMGNSRSQFWHADDWRRHLGDSAVVCHYYGNGETLYKHTTLTDCPPGKRLALNFQNLVCRLNFSLYICRQKS